MFRVDQRTLKFPKISGHISLSEKLTIQELSTLLSKFYRQTQRIIIKVQKKGMLGIKHGNTG